MTVRKIFIRFCNNIRKRRGWISFCGGWNFSKLVSMDPMFIREMRVLVLSYCEYSNAPKVNTKGQIKPQAD